MYRTTLPADLFAARFNRTTLSANGIMLLGGSRGEGAPLSRVTAMRFSAMRFRGTAGYPPPPPKQTEEINENIGKHEQNCQKREKEGDDDDDESRTQCQRQPLNTNQFTYPMDNRK